MNRPQLIGWKCYGVGTLSILFGAIMLRQGNVVDGVKSIIFGLAIIALRDAIGKILRTAEDNRRTLSDLRAAIETSLERSSARR